MKGRFTSRKLLVLILQVIVTTTLPLVYRKLDIEGDITLFVLIAINGAGALYTGANVFSKKYNADLPQRGRKASSSDMGERYGG